jgi:predicted RNA-binding Zn ribbon-like protein
VTTRPSENFRAYRNGRQLGDVLTRDQVAQLEASIAENAANGIADPDSELVVECLGTCGWYIKRVRSWGPPIFDKVADDG